MIVLTKYPIIRTSGPVYSNIDDDTKKALVGTGIATGGALIAGLASKGRKQLTDIEQKCGKRPKFGKAKKQQYNDCIAKANAPAVDNTAMNMPSQTQPEKTGMSKNTKIAIGAGIAVVLVIVAIVIIKKRKNAGK